MELYFDENLKLNSYDYMESYKGTSGYEYLSVYVPKTLVNSYNAFQVNYYARLVDGDEIGAIRLGAVVSGNETYYVYKQLLDDKVLAEVGNVLLTIEFAIKRTATGLWSYKTSGALKYNVQNAVSVDGDIIIGDAEDYSNLVSSMKESIQNMGTSVDTNTNNISALKNNYINLSIISDETQVILNNDKQKVYKYVDSASATGTRTYVYSKDYIRLTFDNDEEEQEIYHRSIKPFSVDDEVDSEYQSLNDVNHYIVAHYNEDDACVEYTITFNKEVIMEQADAYITGHTINSAINTVKTYSDTNRESAKTYADGVVATAVTTCKTYADTKIATQNGSTISNLTIPQMGSGNTAGATVGYVNQQITSAMQEHIVNQYWTETSTTRTLNLVLNNGTIKQATFTKDVYKLLNNATYNTATKILTFDFVNGQDVDIDLSGLNDVYDVENAGHNVVMSLSNGKFSADLSSDVTTFLNNAQTAEGVRVTNEQARQTYFNSVKTAIANNNGRVAVYNLTQDTGADTYTLTFNDIALPNG